MNVPGWYEGDVSRETLERLDEFAKLLQLWTKKINLISSSSVEHIASRHIWDSAQAYEKMGGHWLDIGSGGGLPGIVFAILRKADGATGKTTLVESDQRKCTFLRTCIRSLDLDAQVVAERIEAVSPQGASVLSARALAGLNQLLGYALPHLETNGRCVFLKGASWREEVNTAQTNWRFSYEAAASKTNPEAAILTIKDIERV